MSRPGIEPGTRCLKGAFVVCANPSAAIPGTKRRGFVPSDHARDGEGWGPVPVHTRYTLSPREDWATTAAGHGGEWAALSLPTGGSRTREPHANTGAFLTSSAYPFVSSRLSFGAVDCNIHLLSSSRA